MASLKPFLIMIVLVIFITIEDAYADAQGCIEEIKTVFGDLKTFKQCYERMYKDLILNEISKEKKYARNYIKHMENFIYTNHPRSPNAHCGDYETRLIAREVRTPGESQFGSLDAIKRFAKEERNVCMKQMEASKFNQIRGSSAFFFALKSKKLTSFEKNSNPLAYFEYLLSTAVEKVGAQNPNDWCKVQM